MTKTFLMAYAWGKGYHRQIHGFQTFRGHGTRGNEDYQMQNTKKQEQNNRGPRPPTCKAMCSLPAKINKEINEKTNKRVKQTYD